MNLPDNLDSVLRMGISVWLGVPGALLACGVIVSKGGKTWAWLRTRYRRSEPQVWVIEPERPRARVRSIDQDEDRGWHNIG